jgi:glutamate carboxypeptidase
MSIPQAIAKLPLQSGALETRLIEWAEINSGSGHPAGLARMADRLETALRSLTPAVRRLPVGPDGARHVLEARLRPEAPHQILCSGHYDTVYEPDSPFQNCRRLDAGRLQGPGVADMKGGLVVLLAALNAFEQTPAAAALGFTILLTPDEEIGSAASRALLEAAAPHHQLGLIFEPARESGDIVHSRKGTGIFRIACHGRAAHAGRAPETGRNAILALAEYLLALKSLPEELPGLMLNVGRIHGGGTVNVVPDFAEAELNARSASTTTAEAFARRLHELAAPWNHRDGYRFEITGQFNRPAMEGTPQAEALFPPLQTCATDLGLPPFDWVHVGGGSDGNLLQAAGLPCLDGLGAIGGALHSPDEYIELPSLTQRAQLSALFLHRLADGTMPFPPAG